METRSRFSLMFAWTHPFFSIGISICSSSIGGAFALGGATIMPGVYVEDQGRPERRRDSTEILHFRPKSFCFPQLYMFVLSFKSG